jgi:C4-dicarboxylate-specific signal transduction histidine kinase
MFRRDTSERLPADINETIRAVLAIVRIDLQKSDAELQTQLDERVSVVEGDKVQLQQVVLNESMESPIVKLTATLPIASRFVARN